MNAHEPIPDAADPPTPESRLHPRRLIVPALTLAVGAVLLRATQDLSERFTYHAVIHALIRIGPTRITEALLAAALSYVGLIGRDALALRYLGLRPPRSIVWLSAFIGSAMGNALGFGTLTGGAVRYRILGAAGARKGQVARLMLLTGAAFILGLVLFGGLSVLLTAPMLHRAARLPVVLLRGSGALAVAVALGIIAFHGRVRTGWRWGRVALDLPDRRFLIGQLGFIAVDLLGAGLCLWAVLPAIGTGFPTFMAVYIAALLLGVIGHTPGGIGVFDALIIYTLGHGAPAGAVVAALLVYRSVYFVLPLLVSTALLAGFETRGIAARLAPKAAEALARGPQLLPMFLAVITFVIGMSLVISGAVPAFTHRLELLAQIVPLWLVEGSNMAASLVGVLLLFVARGLFFRLDAAWWLALGLAAVGLFVSLARGLAFVEAGVLLFLIVVLISSRARFNRPASLFERPLSAEMLVAVALVLGVAFWIFLFAFRHVPYSRELWWQFEFDDKASRSLRGTVAAALLAAGIGLWQMLRLGPGRAARPTPDDLLAAERIARCQPRSDAMLAMMGDKSFLFSDSGRTFLMYAKRGRNWVALHDPVGPREEWPALISAFIALAHAHAGRAAFYQVRSDALPFYLETGLRLMKLGEEALISLGDFSLLGAQMAHLRYALKRGTRDGLATELLTTPAEAFPMLRAISDAWLTQRRATEKGFSVAAFDEAYLARQSVMLVRQHERPVAFVTFMTTDLRTEATVGVMRHVADTSPYAMEFVFTQLALHLRAAGYERLSLGMAPLSGLAVGRRNSFWYRIGYLLWRHGNRVYSFRGLRGFKSKFLPVWEPRYLATTGLLGPARTLAAVVAAVAEAETP